MDAKIYQTQKGNWAILLRHSSKASLLTNPQEWQKNAEYLENSTKTELIVGEKLNQLKEKLPLSLYSTLEDMSKKLDLAVEYLDI
jgi:EXLDI family protein